MNKISKKILAIVTMAAFVVTMMPFAAFAADTDASYQTSYFVTEKEDATVKVGTAATAVFEINDTTGVPAASDKTLAVKIWATDEQGRTTDALSIEKGDVTEVDGVYTVKDTDTVGLKFSRAGVYTIHAAVNNDGDDKYDDELTYVDGYDTITVTAGDSADVTAITVEQDGKPVAATTGTSYKLATVRANNTSTKTVTITAQNAGKALAGKEFSISTNSSGITVTPADTATTDRKGEFDLTYKVSREGEYKIYLTCGEYSATLNVIVEGDNTQTPSTITTSVNNAQVLNINDIKQNSNLDDAVQFTIEDQNGVEMAKSIPGQPASDAYISNYDGSTGENPADFISVIDAPEDFDPTTEYPFAITWDGTEGVYTLKYKGEPSELVEGEYTVRVALLATGDYADATFTVGKYTPAADNELKIVPAEENVLYSDGTKGTTYKVVLVDENGIEKDITADGNYSMGIKSVNAVDAKITSAGNITWTVPSDKEDAVGSKITLTAVSSEYGQMVTAEITLVDETEVEATLAFDPTNGPANKTNTVKVSVVDENGDVVDTVGGKVIAYVADQSNEDAKVEVVGKNDVKKGENGTLTIFSDKETTVDVVVAVVAENNQLYANTLEYTVGEEAAPEANTTVAMTIGSSDIIVNNDIVSGDAAPYVDSNWRTMVPLRALTEAFGGTAEWDGDARTVTVVNGDTTIVFDADSNKYTVNDTEKEMDTNLVINEGRTYVPVRFVAEELGYQITVLKDAQNLTAGVVFQK